MQPGDCLVVEHKTTALEIGSGSPYWRRLTLDAQVSNYVAGARALGLEPRGVLYDVVRKINMRPYTATAIEDRKFIEPKTRACSECKKKKGTPAPHRWILSDEQWVLDVTDAVNAPGQLCADGRITTDPGGRLHANQRDRDETLDEYRARIREDIKGNFEKYYQRGIVVRLEDEERDAAFDAWAVGREIRESQLARRWPRNPDACDSYGSLCQFFDVCTGVTTIDDPTRFKDKENAHEELQGLSLIDATPEDKKSLPILSTSSARCYRTCPRKYLFAYELRRRSVRDAASLRFGSLFHAGLEAWWQRGDLLHAIARMREQYVKHDIDAVDAVRAEELLLGYHVRWVNEPLEVLAVEKEFRAPLVNPETEAQSRTWQRGGKIDALVRAVA